ncbi:MAG TPA: poly-beta-1,6 N-acetyl-D-glucosamine export porin PgaA [Gammaproteobacteria bacterium]|nr:poly-beta-1,6 N-acetyl-D-glucosamine export porin PgaA [Gammaproteobacteria bacterium]
MRNNYPKTGASLGMLRTAAFSLLGLIFAAALAPAGAQDSTESRHARAIAQARAGHYAEAITALDDLRRAAPADAALLADAIVVRGWAERDAEVVDLAERLPVDVVTLDVARAAAKAARNLRRYDLATRWYRRAIELDPAADGRIGLAMTQADAGDPAAADATLAAIPAAQRDTAPVRAARAYVREREGAPLAAMNEYDAMLAHDPADRVALRGKALALRALLLPEQALALAAEHPGILTDAETARLKVDRLAIELRLAARTPYPGSGKRVRAEATLARLDEALPAVADPAARLALELDRVVALVEAGHPEAAVAAFESLPAAVARPPYVLVAVSDAYRTLHRPEDALRALRSATPGDADLDLQFALIYTYLDLEDFASAFALADRVASALPVTNSAAGSAVVRGNEDRMRAELTAGTAYAYGDQLQSAQARFEGLLREAPGNADLRHELANVYRWRGWLDRSLFEYRQVLTVSPDLLPARVGYTYAQIDAREYRDVDVTIGDLTKEFAREPVVEKLAEEWRLHNRSELSVTATNGSSTGTTFGSDSYRVDSLWYSRPQVYRWRALVHLHDAYALFPEGDVYRRRIGAGLEYRAPRFTATGEVSGARSGGEAGLRGDLDWRLSDYWSVAALLDFTGNDVPLRGYRAGVDADAAGLTATYARDESMSIAVGTRAQRYTDGNGSQSVFVDGRYRLVNAPRTKLELTGELGASRSDRSDVAYFSPLADTTLLVGLHDEWRLFRRYDRSVTQNADISVGRYDQRGFSPGSIWRLRYTLQWQPSPRLAVSAGLERSRQFFDGTVEHSTGFVATLRARL